MRILPELHPHHHLPIHSLDSLEEFEPSESDGVRIYQLAIGDGMVLGFAVRAIPSRDQVLQITMHGAKGGQKGFVFNRFSSSMQSGRPFLIFADPTLTLDEGNLLAWYVGTPMVNPDDWMEPIVRKVLAATGAVFPVFSGSSGGGFVSMRLATRFSRSIAVPLSGQTDIFRYYDKRWATRTMDTAFDGMNGKEMVDLFTGRARIIDLYTDPRWNRGNLIHYVQNVGDRDHVEKQLNVFLAELGESPDSYLAMQDRLSISRPFIGRNHIATPVPIWDGEEAIAIARLKQLFLGQDVSTPEEPFERPDDWKVPEGVILLRSQSIQEY
jgi:hypothetical protein